MLTVMDAENLFLHATEQLVLPALSASCRDIRDQGLLCCNCMRSESVKSAMLCIAAINVQLMVIEIHFKACPSKMGHLALQLTAMTDTPIPHAQPHAIMLTSNDEADDKQVDQWHHMSKAVTYEMPALQYVKAHVKRCVVCWPYGCLCRLLPRQPARGTPTLRWTICNASLHTVKQKRTHGHGTCDNSTVLRSILKIATI